MWGKREQVVLWGTAYAPLVLIMAYKFIGSNLYFSQTSEVKWLTEHVPDKLLGAVAIVIIIGLSLLLYYLIAIWIFWGFDQKLARKEIGKEVWVRNRQTLSVNEYSFFLMTLLLPLISMGFSSVVNLTITCWVIVIVVFIYVKTDTISVCPIFFLSGRRVYKGIISDQLKEEEQSNPLARQEVILITNVRSLNSDKTFRTVHLIGDVYYMSEP